MLIDWFTVGAQALNFIILVWVMKHFLYQPILHAIDAREKKIAGELGDADARRAEANKDRDEFRHKNEEFDQQRAALLARATDEAKAERQRLLDAAHQAADVLSARRSEALKNEARNLYQAVTRRTQDEVFAIARKVLTDLATTSLEERMGDVFTRRLRGMDGKARETMDAAIKTTPAPAVVRSAFALPPDERAKIQNAINETFSADVPLRFETAPDLVSGIELTANGQKLAWSIADYLRSLEQGVGELLKQQEKPEPKPPAEHTPRPETEAKAKPMPAAEPKAAAQPEGGAKPLTKPADKVELGAKPGEPAKAAPGVKAETPKPRTAATLAPGPEATAGSTAEVKGSPAPASKTEAQAGSKPATETKSTTDAVLKAAPEPRAKAEPAAAAGAAPAPATPLEPNAAAAPATEAKAKPEPAEAAPAGS